MLRACAVALESAALTQRLLCRYTLAWTFELEDQARTLVDAGVALDVLLHLSTFDELERLRARLGSDVALQAALRAHADLRSSPPPGRCRSLKEAGALARALGLSTRSEWRAFVSSGARPPDVPRAPTWSYRDQGWSGWAQFLGRSDAAALAPRAAKRGEPRRAWQPFAAARAFASSLGLRSASHWFAYCRGGRADLPRRPDNVPANPYASYQREGWTTWSDFLGTTQHGARPFPAARAFARSLGLRSRREWEAFCRTERPDLGPRPLDVPARPDRRYCESEWQGWRDWLRL